jgi:hypothetical protein
MTGLTRPNYKHHQSTDDAATRIAGHPAARRRIISKKGRLYEIRSGIQIRKTRRRLNFRSGQTEFEAKRGIAIQIRAILPIR